MSRFPPKSIISLPDASSPGNGFKIAVADSSGAERKIDWSQLPSGSGGGGGISNVVEDTTPQLGGPLDLNSSSILGTGGINITGSALITDDYTAFNGTNRQINIAQEVIQESSTGATSGGVITIDAGNTTYSVTAGTGHIVDAQTNTFTEVTWNAASNITPTINGDGPRWVYVDDTGTIFDSLTAPTPTSRRDNILLGRVVEAGGTLIAEQPQTVFDEQPVNQLYDFFAALRLFNIEGNAFSAAGNDLTIAKSAGSFFVAGGNYDNDTKDPHTVTLPAESPANFIYYTQTDLSNGGAQTLIDPANYDVSGTVTAVPGANRRSTNQRVYLFPNGTIGIQYGQTIHNNLADAIQATGTEAYVENPSFFGNGICIAIISMRKDATDLSDPDQARFLLSSRFGESAIGAAGTSVTSLQQAYNNSADGNIIVDSSTGSVSVLDAGTPIGETLFDVSDNAGTENYFSVSATGAKHIITADGSDAFIVESSGLDLVNVSVAGGTTPTLQLFANTAVKGVSNPVDAFDAANKLYVDDNSGIVDLEADTTPTLGGNLNTNDFGINWGNVGDFSGVTTSLPNNSSGTLFSFPVENIMYTFEYYLNNKPISGQSVYAEGGTFTVVCDNNNRLAVNNTSTTIGTSGVTFTAVINGSNVDINWTTTDNGNNVSITYRRRFIV